MSMEIPVIDLRDLESGSLQDLAAACEEWGFFQLVNHGLTERYQFLAAMREFFDLSIEEKRRLSRTEENPWGFFDKELTKNKPDWKEIFDFGFDDTDESEMGFCQWPENSPQFKNTMLTWFKQCEVLSLILLQHICETLDQPGDILSSQFSPRNSSFLRLNHYPVCDTLANGIQDQPVEGHLGIHHHTDAGALTVLVQDDVSGLQVYSTSGWQPVLPQPEALIVNIGDLIQVWSNNRYKAPVHRVLVNNEKARYSAPFFLNPAFSCECQPLAQLNEPPLYHPLNWGKFRQARAAGDYTNLGTESQVTDYLIG